MYGSLPGKKSLGEDQGRGGAVEEEVVPLLSTSSGTFGLIVDVAPPRVVAGG
jgi:hypothetical protein